MFEKIKFEHAGVEYEFNCRRMPQSTKAKMFDKLVRSRVDGMPSTEVMSDNRCAFICQTFVDDAGKPLFKPNFPAEETTWGDDSVQRVYPQLWDSLKFVKFAAEAEKWQSPKMEDVAKNSTATTGDDSSSTSQ